MALKPPLPRHTIKLSQRSFQPYCAFFPAAFDDQHNLRVFHLITTAIARPHEQKLAEPHCLCSHINWRPTREYKFAEGIFVQWIRGCVRPEPIRSDRTIANAALPQSPQNNNPPKCTNSRTVSLYTPFEWPSGAGGGGGGRLARE